MKHLLLTFLFASSAMAGFTPFSPAPIAPNSLANKAELFSHDGADDAVLAPGTDGYVLVRDDAEVTGLKWIDFPASSGTGTFNYLVGDDSDFEIAVGGWTGDTGIAATRAVTNGFVLRKTGFLQIIKNTGDKSGETVKSPVFSIDAGDLGKDITIKFDYEVLSGDVAPGDVIIEIIKDPLGVPVVISVDNENILQGAGTHNATFRADATEKDYQLTFKQVTAVVPPTNIGFDNIKISPLSEESVYLAGYLNNISNWIDSTCTATWTTNSTTTCKYRQVGDSASIEWNVALSGSPNATTLLFNMPSEIVIDSSKMVGTASFGIDGSCSAKSAATGIEITALYASDTSVYATYISNTTNRALSLVSNVAPVTWVSGDSVTCTVTVPVLGWSSSTDAVVRNKSLLSIKASGNAGEPLTANFTDISFNETFDNQGAWNGTQFTVPEDGEYLISGVISSTATIGGGGIQMYINTVADRFVGLVSDTGGLRTSIRSVLRLSAGQVISFRSNVPLTLVNNPAIHYLSITQQPENFVISGTFGECQTKFLSANVTTDTTDVSDLRFTNLTVGNYYTLKYAPRFQGSVTGDEMFTTVQTSSLHSLHAFLYSGGTPTSYVETIFIAGNSTLTFDLSSITAGNFFLGNGGVDQTHATLCESNKGVTTKW